MKIGLFLVNYLNMFNLIKPKSVNIFDMYLKYYKQSFELRTYSTYISDLKVFKRLTYPEISKYIGQEELKFFLTSRQRRTNIKNSSTYSKLLENYLPDYTDESITNIDYKIFYDSNRNKLQKYYAYDNIDTSIFKNYSNLVLYKKMVLIELHRILEFELDFIDLLNYLFFSLVNSLSFNPNNYLDFLKLRNKIIEYKSYDSTKITDYLAIIENNIHLLRLVKFSKNFTSTELPINKELKNLFIDELTQFNTFCETIYLHFNDLETLKSNLNITDEKFNKYVFNYLIFFVIMVEIININLYYLSSLPHES